jgi:hypothetical protein
MSKPSAFAGKPEQDVEVAIAQFENYLSATSAPLPMWPAIATNFLKDEAAICWMNAFIPAKKAGTPVTWSTFTSCLLGAFGQPNKELTARRQFKNIRQRSSTVHDYINHATTLLSRIHTDPPTETDRVGTLFDGLHPVFKEAAPVHPSGRPWATFSELATHLQNLETSMPQKFHKARMEPVPKKPTYACAVATRPPAHINHRQRSNKSPARPPSRPPTQYNNRPRQDSRAPRPPGQGTSRQDRRDDDSPAAKFARLPESEQRRMWSMMGN